MPWQKFSQVNVPKETNYSESYNWIVHPDTLDLGKFLPQKTQISATRSDVAVFFIHPTTYINRNNWNQPPNDPEANEILRKRILVNQASIFSACCEVYVPRYRQATLSSFAALNYNKVNAFSVAYKDILNSFKYFDENFRKKRPFIIASHSQGSMHAVKLLNNLKNNKQLFSNLIAAYLIGYSITKKNIYPVKVCDTEISINCIIAWNSIEEDGFVTFTGNENLICVNPLSWRENEIHVPHTFNLGGVGFDQWSTHKLIENWSLIKLEDKVAGARCMNGNLEVTNLTSANFPVRLFSLHAYD